MPMPPKEDDAFLSRWSKRKRAGVEEEAVPAVEAEAPAPPPPLEEELTDEEILAELNLPDPDAMTASDDFSAFMQARVPERLRRRALRVLWRSNPVLANLDGMVDYGEDFTDSATVIENMQTVYEVGRGVAWKWEEKMAALAEEEAAREAEEGEGEPEPVAEVEAVPEAIPAPPPEPESVVVAALPDPEPVPDLPSAPRPMRFAFD